jgi:hypothetical protein
VSGALAGAAGVRKSLWDSVLFLLFEVAVCVFVASVHVVGVVNSSSSGDALGV